MQYAIRELGWAVEVTKWEEWSRRPIARYHVILNRDEWNECSCLGSWRWGQCKHGRMVREWLREGRPVAINMGYVGLGPWGWGIS